MDRKGVFADVLQETLLATYRRSGRPYVAPVHVIVATSETSTEIEAAGTFTLPEAPGAPWLLPRTTEQAPLIARMRTMLHRLRDYGYRVSTGPLVWNRHKSQLRADYAPGSLPLIWAESVAPDGRFAFRSEKKNHKPFFAPETGDDWLITRTPCVLVQRTTAKEQRRRLVAAELPGEFIDRHGAVVVENHLNMVRPIDGMPTVSPATIAALLNSYIVDEAFRCINGSVAVSASELEALPLPKPEDMERLEKLLHDGASQASVNDVIHQMYLKGGAS
jgi:adenine-specific DNA-methyltransferase